MSNDPRDEINKALHKGVVELLAEVFGTEGGPPAFIFMAPDMQMLCSNMDTPEMTMHLINAGASILTHNFRATMTSENTEGDIELTDISKIGMN